MPRAEGHSGSPRCPRAPGGEWTGCTLPSHSCHGPVLPDIVAELALATGSIPGSYLGSVSALAGRMSSLRMACLYTLCHIMNMNIARDEEHAQDGMRAREGVRRPRFILIVVHTHS